VSAVIAFHKYLESFALADRRLAVGGTTLCAIMIIEALLAYRAALV
jgi:hypothetical protein